MQQRKTKIQGFNLVELMITIAVIGIIAAIGIPSFTEMLNQNHATSLVNEFAASLNLARSEAIKQGVQVSVCKSSNIATTNPTCSTTAHWHDGWLIFVDKSTSGTFDSSTDSRLKVGQPSSSNVVISASTTFANYISYLPSGISKGSNLSNGTIDICIDGIERSITLNITGRIRISKGTC